LAPKITKLKTVSASAKRLLCNFWRQNISAKLERKMLMKLTPGANPIK